MNIYKKLCERFDKGEFEDLGTIYLSNDDYVEYLNIVEKEAPSVFKDYNSGKHRLSFRGHPVSIK